MNRSIKLLTANDAGLFRQLIHIFGEVFDMGFIKFPANTYLASLLAKVDFKVFVCQHEGKVIGGLTVYVLSQYYNESSVAYIYDIGVTPEFQGQGIGRQLIHHLSIFCTKNGIHEAYVDAEADDQDAIRFYHKTNFSQEMGTRQFTYTF